MSHQFDSLFFVFNATANTEIYTLSLHDALPISVNNEYFTWDELTKKIKENQTNKDGEMVVLYSSNPDSQDAYIQTDRKSTRLNSSHVAISYAVFCLKKKKKNEDINITLD